MAPPVRIQARVLANLLAKFDIKLQIEQKRNGFFPVGKECAYLFCFVFCYVDKNRQLSRSKIRFPTLFLQLINKFK